MQSFLEREFVKDRFQFQLYIIGNMTASFFHRGFDYRSYDADPVKDVMDAAAFMMTAHEYEGFKMPRPFPIIPGCVYPYRIKQTDFLDAYRKSAKILGASKIKNAWLDIAPPSIVLRVQVG